MSWAIHLCTQPEAAGIRARFFFYLSHNTDTQCNTCTRVAFCLNSVQRLYIAWSNVERVFVCVCTPAPHNHYVCDCVWVLQPLVADYNPHINRLSMYCTPVCALVVGVKKQHRRCSVALAVAPCTGFIQLPYSNCNELIVIVNDLSSVFFSRILLRLAFGSCGLWVAAFGSLLTENRRRKK